MLDTNETIFTGDSSLAGWVIGWSGKDGLYYPQVPKLRIGSGPIVVRVETPSPYLVAEIEVDESGTIHHVALNQKERG